jgi:hypothetical protein
VSFFKFFLFFISEDFNGKLHSVAWEETGKIHLEKFEVGTGCEQICLKVSYNC